jgi:hypothetical protein
MIFGISKTTLNGVLALLITIGLALLASGSPLIGAKATAIITLVLAVLRAVVGFLQGDAAPNSSTPAAVKGAVLALLAVGLGFGVMGCKGTTANVPLAPGYYTAAEQNVGEVIAAAKAAVTTYESQRTATGFVAVPGEQQTMTAIQQALVIADPLAIAWHASLSTDTTAPEPAALVTAVKTINSGMAALPGGVK